MGSHQCITIPLVLVASLIKFYTGTPETLGPFLVCSHLYSSLVLVRVLVQLVQVLVQLVRVLVQLVRAVRLMCREYNYC